MRHIVPISGKDSLATALVLLETTPDTPFEYLFNDTEFELPETYEWLDKVEKFLQKPITRIGANLKNIIVEQGILPSPRARYCTRLSKIYPMEKYLRKDILEPLFAIKDQYTTKTLSKKDKKNIKELLKEAETELIESNPIKLYLGIRSDEDRVGYVPVSKLAITPVYPLIETKETLSTVLKRLQNIDLMPPSFFWQELWDKVYAELGDRLSILSFVEKHILFAWRSRNNCYFCFFQRQYEYIGLYLHHPDLFWDAVELEENTGAEGYTFQPSYSLRSLVDKKDKIINRRVQEIVKYVLNKEAQIAQGLEIDDLGLVSCGVFCGK